MKQLVDDWTPRRRHSPTPLDRTSVVVPCRTPHVDMAISNQNLTRATASSRQSFYSKDFSRQAHPPEALFSPQSTRNYAFCLTNSYAASADMLRPCWHGFCVEAKLKLNGVHVGMQDGTCSSMYPGTTTSIHIWTPQMQVQPCTGATRAVSMPARTPAPIMPPSRASLRNTLFPPSWGPALITRRSMNR